MKVSITGLLNDIGVDAGSFRSRPTQLAHHYFPDLPLYGGTQMTIHNHWGAAFADAALNA